MTNEEALRILHCPDTVGGLYSEKYGEALNMAMGALKREPCEDAISRQAVEDAIAEMIVNGESLGYAVAWDILSDLPSVTPQPRIRKWSHDDSHWANRFICSECGYKLFEEQTKYCPNCGVRMVESQESEVQE